MVLLFWSGRHGNGAKRSVASDCSVEAGSSSGARSDSAAVYGVKQTLTGNKRDRVKHKRDSVKQMACMHSLAFTIDILGINMIAYTI